MKSTGERMLPELNKILESPYRAAGIRLLMDLGFLQEILPEVAELRDCQHDSPHHLEGDVYCHTLLVMASIPWEHKPSLALAWAALLHDIGKPATKRGGTFYSHESVGAHMAEGILTRLKAPGQLIQDTVWLVLNHMKAHRLHQLKATKLAVLVRDSRIEDLLLLGKADSLGRMPANYDPRPEAAVRDLQEKLGQKTLKKLGIDGRTLMQRLQKDPGPWIGQLLKRLDNLMIENPTLDGDGLLALAKL